MTQLLSSRVIRRGAVAVTIGALALTMSACANPNPVPATITPSASATTTPTASSAALVGVPMTLTCDDILSSDALYALKGGTNLAPDPNFKPAANTAAAQVAGLKGVNCGFINLTSGDTFNVSVAQVSPESNALLKSQLATAFGPGSLVAAFSPTDQIKGYFHVNGSTGEAQIATSAYWIVVSSDTFSQAADVEDIVVDVENALGR